MSDFTSEFHNTVPTSAEINSARVHADRKVSNAKKLTIATGVVGLALAIDSLSGGGGFDPELYSPSEEDQQQSIEDLTSKGPGRVVGEELIVHSGANIRSTSRSPNGKDVAEGIASNNVIGQVPEGHNLVIDMPYALEDKVVCVTENGKIAWVDLDLRIQEMDNGEPFMEINQGNDFQVKDTIVDFSDSVLQDSAGVIVSQCRIEPVSN